MKPKWQRNVQRALAAGLILSGLYVAIVFIQRAREPEWTPPAVKPLPLSPDYFVYTPKSQVRDLADARGLVGKPLWVREGYRWVCTPGPETLGPMEKVTPTRAFQRGGQVFLEFVRDGRPCAIPVSAGDSFFVDELFLIKDPREIYKDWNPNTWEKIAERRVEAGMTETQITFAIGYGQLVRELSRAGDAHRVMDYTGGDRRVRVTYEYGVAKKVDPLPN